MMVRRHRNRTRGVKARSLLETLRKGHPLHRLLSCNYYKIAVIDCSRVCLEMETERSAIHSNSQSEFQTENNMAILYFILFYHGRTSAFKIAYYGGMHFNLSMKNKGVYLRGKHLVYIRICRKPDIGVFRKYTNES